MAKYIQRIMTADGEKQIDYNALANLPIIPDVSAEIEERVTAVEEGKVDEWDGATGGYYTLRARSTNSQGETTTRFFPLYSTPLANTLAMWDSNKRLSTEAPTGERHCANKKYVDDLGATKLDIFTVTNNAGNKVYRARSDGGQDTIYIGESPDYITQYYPSTKGDTAPKGYLVTNTPIRDYQAANKKYVDDMKSELEMLGLFYKVVKVTGGGSQWVDIPEGAMTTAYIESATFDAYHTEKGLVYSGTADHLYFENNQGIVSDTSITAPAYFQIPEGATQIRVNCDECIPSDVDWDAGPVTFTGYIYFQVKRG